MCCDVITSGATVRSAAYRHHFPKSIAFDRMKREYQKSQIQSRTTFAKKKSTFSQILLEHALRKSFN